MTILLHDGLWSDSAISALACNKRSIDLSEEIFNTKRQKPNSDLVTLYEGEELLLGDHIVPVEPELLQSLDGSLDYLDGLSDNLDGLGENIWIASLLDSDRSLLATLEFSFVDDGFSLEGGFL